MRLINKGREFSEEVNKRKGDHCRGKKQSEEHKTKLRKPKSEKAKASYRRAQRIRYTKEMNILSSQTQSIPVCYSII